MTLKQLKAKLALLGPEHDDKNVVVWIPGSRVDLHDVMGAITQPLSGMQGDQEIWVEGNLREGSALL